MNTMTTRRSYKGKSWLPLWSVSDTPSVITCHFKDDTKVIYPDRHICFSFFIWILIIIYAHNNYETFWARWNFGHHCGPSHIVSLSWVVVIDHIIFTTRRVFLVIFGLNSRIDDFIVVTDLLIFHIWRNLLGFFPFQSKTALIVGYINYAKSHVF